METTKLLFRVTRKEINIVQWIIESYDGMAAMRTVDPQEAIIEIMVSPGCRTMILELVYSLRERYEIERMQYIS